MDYITQFQLLAGLAGITDMVMLIDLFNEGLDPEIVSLIISMPEEPKDFNAWVAKASQFNSQKMRLEQYRKGRTIGIFWSPHPSRPPRDPNAMDIDSVKLTPLE